MEFETIIQNELNYITSTIMANTNPESIYLFGSYVNGTPNADSDLDIYVVVHDSEDNLIDLCAKIRIDIAQKKTMPLDLLIGKKAHLRTAKTD